MAGGALLFSQGNWEWGDKHLVGTTVCLTFVKVFNTPAPPQKKTLQAVGLDPISLLKHHVQRGRDLCHRHLASRAPIHLLNYLTPLSLHSITPPLSRLLPAGQRSKLHSTWVIVNPSWLWIPLGRLLKCGLFSRSAHLCTLAHTQFCVPIEGLCCIS